MSDNQFPPIPKNQVRSRNSIEQHEHEDDADARRVVPVDQDGDFFGTPQNPVSVQGVISPGSGVGTPTIFNVPTVLANTEYSQLLPADTTQFLIKVREGDAIMKIAFATGDTSLNWITVGFGQTFFVSDIDLPSNSIYFQLSKANKTVEILTWS